MIVVASLVPASNDLVSHLQESGYHLETKLIERHVHISGARDQTRLAIQLSYIIEPVKLEETLDGLYFGFDNYEREVKTADSLFEGKWFLNDCRPLFFLPDFVNLVKDCKLIAFGGIMSVVGIAKIVKNYDGDVLITDSEPTVNEIDEFLRGKQE